MKLFKNFKKNDKYFTIAVYVFLVVAALIGLIFVFMNFGKITTFLEGLIKALMSFVYGFCIAYICNPIYKRLHKNVFKFVEKKKEHPKLRKGLSIFLTYIIFFALITLLLFAIIPQITNNIQDLGANITEYGQNFVNSLNNFLTKISSIFPSINPDEIIQMVQNMFSSEGDDIFNYILQNSSSILEAGSAVVSQIFAFFVGIILSIYFLIYKDFLLARLKRLLCSIFKKEGYERIINFGRYTDKTFGRYLLGAILDSILVGIVVFLVLTIAKFPLAPLIGVIVGVTNVIPFFGPFLGGIPSALLILIHSDGGLARALIFVVIIVIVQQIDGNIITPHIQGSATGLTPIGVILAVTVCSHIFGFVGMLIGVPLCAVISYLITILIENKLKKKKMPVNVDCYRAKDIFTDEDFIKAKSAIEAQERIEYHEAVEKAKAENKVSEEVIHQVEERIVDEIINSVAEEIIQKAEAEVKADASVLSDTSDSNDTETEDI